MLSVDKINELERKYEILLIENTQLRECLEKIREEVKNNLKVGLMVSCGWLEQKIDEVLND